MRDRIVALLLVLALAAAAPAQFVYSNGSIITHPNAGAGGANASLMQYPPLGLSGFGVGVSQSARLADDFTVPAGQLWTLQQVRFVGYQTNSGLTPTLNSANWRIWNGPPGVAGSTILHNYSGSNQLSSVAFSNIYRVISATGLLDTARPVMRVTCNVPAGVALGPGSYWLDWQLGGTLSGGPYTPPLSTLGVYSTGNARQYQAGPWVACTDNGYAQGMPFEIQYSSPPPWSFTITQPLGSASIVFTDANGTAGNAYLNVVDVVPGAYPNGWLFGIDIDPMNLVTEILFGPPFYGPLDGGGGAVTVISMTIPAGITLYAVGIEIPASGPFHVTLPFTYTTVP